MTYRIFQNDKIFLDIINLYRNGEFYQQQNELEGALISYSSCTSMIHTILYMKKTEELKEILCTNPVIENAVESTQAVSTQEAEKVVYKDLADTDRNVATNNNKMEYLNKCIEDNIINPATVDESDISEGALIQVLKESEHSFYQKLSSIYQIALSRVEQLQIKLKEKKQTLKQPNKNDDDEEWIKACTQIHPQVFKDGSSDCIFFNDLAGLEKQKDLIKKALIQPLVYENLYPPIGKGFLLYGPPGTGKTLLVKAAVNELQLEDENVRVLFFAPTGATLKGKYVGETEKRIVEAYKCASLAACQCEKKNPGKKYISVIFIDEIDSIAGDRNKDETGLMSNSVNTLLQTMDGIDSSKNVATIGATNYPWELDAAVLRRFDTQILLGLPDSIQIKKALDIGFKSFIKLKLSNWKDICSKYDYILNKTEKKTEEIKDSCGGGCSRRSTNSVDTESSPYNLFQFQYTKSDKLMRAISDELSSETKYFSFSDVDKVMGFAKSLTATSALDYPFYNAINTIPELRVMHDSTDRDLLGDYYISVLNRPRNTSTYLSMASLYYEKLNDIVKETNIIDHDDNSSIGGYDATSKNKYDIDMTKLKDFYSYFHITKFPTNPFIKKGDKIYYNTKILIDLSGDLVFDDPNIKDVFVYCQIDKISKIYMGKYIFTDEDGKVNIESINCLNLSYAQRRNILTKLYNSGSLINARNFNESSKVDIIVCVDRLVQYETPKNKEYIKEIKSLGLHEYLINKLDYRIYSYLAKPLKFISSTRTHLNLFIKNIVPDMFIYHVDDNVNKYKKTDFMKYKKIVIGNLFYKDMSKLDSLTENTDIRIDDVITRYLEDRMELKTFFDDGEFKPTELFKNIKLLIKHFFKMYGTTTVVGAGAEESEEEEEKSEAGAEVGEMTQDDAGNDADATPSLIITGLDDDKKKKYNYSCEQIKLFFGDSSLISSVYDSKIQELESKNVHIEDDNDEYESLHKELETKQKLFRNSFKKFKKFKKFTDKELESIYCSDSILNLLDSSDTKEFVCKNIDKLVEDGFLNLYEKFIDNVYITAENIYNNVVISESINNKIWKWNNQVGSHFKPFGNDDSSFSLFTMKKDADKNFNESISFLDSFFVEKIPFIYEKKFNRFAYEKRMSIDLLRLVITSKNNICNNPLLMKEIKVKVENITNYQGFLSIILNMLASTVGDFGNKVRGAGGTSGSWNPLRGAQAPQEITGSFAEVFGYKSLVNEYMDSSKNIELMFSKFIINFYNIWKTEIRHINNEDDKSNIPLDRIKTFFKKNKIKYYYYNQEEATTYNINPITFSENLEYENIISINSTILGNLNNLIPRRDGDDPDFNKRLKKAKNKFDIKNLNFAIILNDNTSPTMNQYYNNIQEFLEPDEDDANALDGKIDLSLIKDKSTNPSILRFFYETKIDLFDHNYKGIIKTKSFLGSTLSKMNQIMQSLFSDKKPTMTEVRNISEKLKKLNPNLTMLHYILKLTRSIGILNPLNNLVFWSEINNDMVLNRIPNYTSETLDSVYTKFFGTSPEEAEKQAEEAKIKSQKKKNTYYKRLAYITGASNLAGLLYAAPFPPITQITAQYLTYAIGIYASYNTVLAAYNSRGDTNKELGLDVLKNVSAELLGSIIAGAVGTGIAHIANKKMYGDNYLIDKMGDVVDGKFYNVTTNNPLLSSRNMSYPEMTAQDISQLDSGQNVSVTEITKKVVPDHISARLLNKMNFIGIPSIPNIGNASRIYTAVDRVSKNIKSNTPDWLGDILVLGKLALGYQILKSFMKNLLGYDSRSLFNTALEENIGLCGNDTLIFDIKQYQNIEKAALSIDTDEGNKLYIRYLNEYLSLIKDNAINEASSAISSALNADIPNYSTVINNENSYICELNPVDESIELRTIKSANQKKLKIIDVLPDKIMIAANEQPQSYDPILGYMLKDYNENRLKFLEDMKKGKYNKKTGN